MGGVFAQGTGECPDVGPLSLTEEQNLHLQDSNENNSRLTDYFDSEYLVIDFAAHRCPHCVNFANQHNNDEEFQEDVGDNATCDFLALVENNTIDLWLQAI